MRADFWTKSPQQKLSDIGPKGSKKVKNCTKLVHFFTRDGRLRSKWTLFTLFGRYFKNTHSRHYVPLILPHTRNILKIKNSIVLENEYLDVLKETSTTFSQVDRHVIIQMDEVHIRSDAAIKEVKFSAPLITQEILPLLYFL